MSRLWRADKALLLLELRRATRRQRGAVETRLPPYAFVLIVYGLLGVFMAFYLLVGSGPGMALDAMDTAERLLAAATMIGAMTMVNELEQLLVSRAEHELLAALPVTSAMVARARAATSALLACAAAACFIAPSYLVAIVLLPAPFVFGLVVLPLGLLAALCGAAGLVALVLLLVMLLPRRFARGSIGLLRLLVLVALIAVPQLAMLSAAEPTTVQGAWADQLPTVWLAGLVGWWDGTLTPGDGWKIPAGLASSVAMVAALGPLLATSARRMTDASQVRRGAGAPLPARRTPPFGAPSDPIARAAYELMPRMVWRDPRLRAALIGQFLVPIMFLLIAASAGRGRPLLVLVFAPMVLSVSAGATDLCRYSEDYAAAWVLGLMPIDDLRRLWLGVRRYVQQFVVLPVCLILSLAGGVALGSWQQSALLAPTLLAFAMAGSEFGELLVRGGPFSQAMQPGAAGGRMLLSLAVVVLLTGVMASLTVAFLVFDELRSVMVLELGEALLIWLALYLARRRWAKPIRSPVDVADGPVDLEKNALGGR